MDKCLNCQHEINKSPIKEQHKEKFCSSWCTADYKQKEKNKSKKNGKNPPLKPLKNIKNNTTITPFDKDSNKEISVIRPVE